LGGRAKRRCVSTWNQISTEIRYSNLAGTTVVSSTSMVYDPAMRLTSLQDRNSGGSFLANYTYAYDAASQATSEQLNGTTTSYGYDAANELTSFGSTNYSYDLNGNRNYGSYSTGPGNSSNQLQTRRLYLDGVDQVFDRVSSGGTAAWYLSDRLGSIRDITDNSGNVIDHVDFDGFGNVTNETQPSNGDRYKWTGRELDSETGLQYNRARYYAGTLERWTTQDPVGLAAGDPDLYRYAANAPTMASDPAGLDAPVMAGYVALMEEMYHMGHDVNGKWDATRYFVYGLGPMTDALGVLRYNAVYQSVFVYSPPDTAAWYQSLYFYAGTALYGLRGGHGPITSDAEMYEKGCYGLVTLRIGRDPYDPANYFFTHLADATDKAEKLGPDARMFAIQWAGDLDYTAAPTREYCSEVVWNGVKHTDGNHATWVQDTPAQGFWEWLGPKGWLAADDFFSYDGSPRNVTHSPTLPVEGDGHLYDNVVYGVAWPVASAFKPAANGKLNPTEAPYETF
jgi:RHS repeat-associated protein